MPKLNRVHLAATIAALECWKDMQQSQRDDIMSAVNEATAKGEYGEVARTAQELAEVARDLATGLHVHDWMKERLETQFKDQPHGHTIDVPSHLIEGALRPLESALDHYCDMMVDSVTGPLPMLQEGQHEITLNRDELRAIHKEVITIATHIAAGVEMLTIVRQCLR